MGLDARTAGTASKRLRVLVTRRALLWLISHISAKYSEAKKIHIFFGVLLSH
jgi:hypothetical protein